MKDKYIFRKITKEEIPAFIARTNHKKEIQTQK